MIWYRRRNGFYKAFPPRRIEMVNWYVMIGVDQIAVSRLRKINRIIETSAWGASHAELHPTHHYKAIGIANHEKAKWPEGERH